MASNEPKIDLQELTKQHLFNLKSLFAESADKCLAANTRLGEYYTSMSNAIDAKYYARLEAKKAATASNSSSSAPSNKTFDINWNMEYCEACKLAFWPNNCNVRILPKIHITSRTSKTYARQHSTTNARFTQLKYKSYKDKLLKHVANRGIQLVYECSRCKSKTKVIRELRRSPLKFPRVKRVRQTGKEQQATKTPTSATSKSNVITPKNVIHVNEASKAPSSTSGRSVNSKRKFQSLQLKLKENELEQARIKAASSSFGNLADFLQQLS